ncbi:hypothetical protein, partial [Roseiflexus sp.]|uniref:hypothetical protein n=1 Tax=Roseiflexus sp. TaxID=2562120 RepID=UPI00398A8DA7
QRAVKKLVGRIVLEMSVRCNNDHWRLPSGVHSRLLQLREERFVLIDWSGGRKLFDAQALV